MKVILFLLFLYSCSSFMTKKDQAVLRKAHQSGNYDEAISYLKESDNYQREETKLLLYLEQGLLRHAKGNYTESVADFEKAREIYKALYTSSISKGAQSLIANENYKHFLGATYERSLIHFFLALNHFLLHQKEDLDKQEKRRQLFAARAEILSWDSFLLEQIGEKQGQSVFKNDLLARIFGGFIHEYLNTKNDRQIALQLYKDAKNILFRNYNGYKSYNSRYKKFKANFEKLHTLDPKIVKRDYIVETEFQKELNEFLDYKIYALTKKTRPRTFKKLKISDQIKEKIKKGDNITVILQRGIIPEKVAKTEYFPLGTISASSQRGRYRQRDVYGYARSNLGLGYAPYNYSPYWSDMGVNSRASYSVAGTLAIKFEVPLIKNRPIREKITVKILDFHGKQVAEEKMALISPMGDIAEEALAEDSAARYRRIGLRLATKYVSAIVASYATYAGLSQKLGRGLAGVIALAEFNIASSLIQKSEKADIRYWSTLPNDIRISSFHLPPGKYRLRAKVLDHNDQLQKSFLLGKIEIDDSKGKRLFNYRRFH